MSDFDSAGFEKLLKLTDEQLRKYIKEYLQINAWADILDKVREGVKYDREVERNEKDNNGL